MFDIAVVQRVSLALFPENTDRWWLWSEQKEWLSSYVAAYKSKTTSWKMLKRSTELRGARESLWVYHFDTQVVMWSIVSVKILIKTALIKLYLHPEPNHRRNTGCDILALVLNPLWTEEVEKNIAIEHNAQFPRKDILTEKYFFGRHRWIVSVCVCFFN